ncbi:hypothetical protein GOP47_0000955 [Adiantum capillus-veneris]|uniref:Uncharacterized protein n=1 Tax=Adiantum capillus-veneris TaxID=13818 RepID=A0A9D4VFQ0_ADICA|nr:hypothetical protein GOP47_0000955 [Adiantum capillus-veneris]
MAACRKCSHCGGNGHNSRTCPERGGVKLFGVRISSACGSSLRKSASTGNLIETTASPSPSLSPFSAARQDGYASEDLPHTSRQRKKGVPWSEEEHKLFLHALHKLGKGDWRGISKHFVKTRTPTQVASHAQKYFLRQSNLNKRRRRSSLFDMAPDVVEDNAVPETNLPLESEPMKGINSTREASLADEADTPSTSMTVRFPDWRYPLSLDPALFFHYTWPGMQEFPKFSQLPNRESKVVRPTPLTPTIRGEKSASWELSKPSNGNAWAISEHTVLAPESSRGESSRSAFHVLRTVNNNEGVNNQSSLCNAIIIV